MRVSWWQTKDMKLVGQRLFPVSSKSPGGNASQWMGLGTWCIYKHVGLYHAEPGRFNTFIASRSKPALYLGRDVTSSQGCSLPWEMARIKAARALHSWQTQQECAGTLSPCGVPLPTEYFHNWITGSIANWVGHISLLSTKLKENLSKLWVMRHKWEFL